MRTVKLKNYVGYCRYIYRFNPFTRYYEVLEIVDPLEHCIRIKEFNTEWEASKYIALLTDTKETEEEIA